jgi:hypothetical protein
MQGPVGIPPLDPKVVHFLRGLLLPEIEQVEKISNRDLSAWKSG